MSSKRPWLDRLSRPLPEVPADHETALRRARRWNARHGFVLTFLAWGLILALGALAFGQPVSVTPGIYANANVPATLNPSDKSALIALSSGNLVATSSGTIGQQGGARGTSSKSTGQWYFEGVITTFGTGGADGGIGISNAGVAFTTCYQTVVGCSQIFKTGNIYVNGSNVCSACIPLSNGDGVGVAVSKTNAKIWYRKLPSGNWNGSASDNPATNTGGLSISALASSIFPVVTIATGSGTQAGPWTMKFGATTMTGAVPSGFYPGWTN